MVITSAEEDQSCTKVSVGGRAHINLRLEMDVVSQFSSKGWLEQKIGRGSCGCHWGLLFFPIGLISNSVFGEVL
jgi:hypothetical protein